MVEILTRLSRWLLVRDDERPQIAYFLFVFFLLGMGLAVGRGSADALFFKRYGIEYLPAMYAVLGVCLGLASAFYAAYADRLPAERLFLFLLLLVLVLLPVIWFALEFTAHTAILPAYYLVYEVASEILMLHALLYVSQNYDTQQIKRLSPLIFAGAQVGKIAGGAALSVSAPLIGLPNTIFFWFLAAVLLALAVALRHRRGGVSPYYQPAVRGRKGFRRAWEELSYAARYTQQSRLLRMAVFALFFMVIAFFVLGYAINRVYTQHYTGEEALAAFFGVLSVATGAITICLQLLVTNRLLRRFGAQAVNLVYPFTNIVAFVFLLLRPDLFAAVFGSLVRDSILPAIRNPTRQLFFNALPDHIQGRARAFSLVVVMPVGLAVAGLFLLLMQRLDEAMFYLVAGLLAAGAYLFFNLRMNRAYIGTILDSLKEKVWLPRELLAEWTRGGGSEVFEALVRGLRHTNPDIVVSCARTLAREYPERSAPLLIERLHTVDVDLRDRIVRVFPETHHPDLYPYLETVSAHTDVHHKATLLDYLFEKRHPGCRSWVRPSLYSSNPRLAAVGIWGVHCYGMSELYGDARRRWSELLAGGDSRSLLPALELLAKWPDDEHVRTVIGLLEHGETAVQHAALNVLEAWPHEIGADLLPLLERLYESPDPGIRRRVLSCSRRLPSPTVSALWTAALDDPHPEVRETVEELMAGQPDVWTGPLSALILENGCSPRGQLTALRALGVFRHDAGFIETIARTKIEDALACLQAWHVLQRSSGANAGTRLVERVLHERWRQYLDVALLAMERFADATGVRIICAGLASGDPRQMARAREAIGAVRHRPLARALGRVLDRAGHPEPRRNRPGPFADRDSVLGWCARHRDAWLSQCARYALESG